jgi:hypothetical protein
MISSKELAKAARVRARSGRSEWAFATVGKDAQSVVANRKAISTLNRLQLSSARATADDDFPHAEKSELFVNR